MMRSITRGSVIRGQGAIRHTHHIMLLHDGWPVHGSATTRSADCARDARVCAVCLPLYVSVHRSVCLGVCLDVSVSIKRAQVISNNHTIFSVFNRSIMEEWRGNGGLIRDRQRDRRYIRLFFQ